DHLVELGIIHLQYGFLRDIGGRVVDQDIDLAEFAMGGIDEIADVRGAAYMAGQRVDAAGKILHFRGGLLEGFRLAAADDDGGAFAGEQFGDGAADAAAGAGDDGNLIAETKSGCGHFTSGSLPVWRAGFGLDWKHAKTSDRYGRRRR